MRIFLGPITFLLSVAAMRLEWRFGNRQTYQTYSATHLTLAKGV